MKLDYLFFGAHPDDVELSCSGTILEAISRNKKVGIIDFTQGELGTRGNVKLRQSEAVAAKKILGASIRENLLLKDGFFNDDAETRLKIISVIRKYQPDYVFANALEDRHPDHREAAMLVQKSCFLSGLQKINTKNLSVWKPKQLFFYIQDKQLEPSFVVDISIFFEQKKIVISTYASQFYSTEKKYAKEAETYISSALFWNNLEAKARAMGQRIGVAFGEGFMTKNNLGVKNIESFLPAVL